jgi:hypothetical protein
MVKIEREHKQSAAKAAVAMQKPRDAEGRFLSGQELQAYQAQAQQQQFMAERARVNNILGRQSDAPISQPMSPIQQQMGMGNVPAGFEAIIQANKPRGMASDLNEDDKWNMLLGKKRRGF